MGKFQNKFRCLVLMIFLISCQSNSEKALSQAYGAFNYQVNDLQLYKIDFKGPIRLSYYEKKYLPKKHHLIYGWNTVISKDTVWLYVDVDTIFTKEPSVFYSNNFFELIQK